MSCLWSGLVEPCTACYLGLFVVVPFTFWKWISRENEKWLIGGGGVDTHELLGGYCWTIALHAYWFILFFPFALWKWTSRKKDRQLIGGHFSAVPFLPGWSKSNFVSLILLTTAITTKYGNTPPQLGKLWTSILPNFWLFGNFCGKDCLFVSAIIQCRTKKRWQTGRKMSNGADRWRLFSPWR